VYNESKLVLKEGHSVTEHDYQKILELETTPEALEATVNYLAVKMKPFLQTMEPVLICFPDEGPASLGNIFKEAVIRCDATPVFWGPDYRWKTLLQMAFQTHANTIVGHPLVILGLMKLAKATTTPLYVYDVIACGDPFSRWMVHGLKNGLDCKIWGCYAVQSGPIVAGFSCEQEAGIHIREDVLIPKVQYRSKDLQPGPKRGILYFASAKNPELVYDPREVAVVHHHACSCGCQEPRVVETFSSRQDIISRMLLEDKFLTWSSVLDYRAEYTESGTALELVVFPGESLPKIPTFAKLNVRPWNPEEDIPFCMERYALKIKEKGLESY